MNKIKYGIIYRIHNKVTDNNYIGKTTRNFKKRYGNLNGFIREKKSTDSIQEDYAEYGIDSFEVFEEIDCVYRTNDGEYDKDLLSITESYYIKKYNARSGYNVKECDYPLSISLFPNVSNRGLNINYKFELQDYYNFLFTDEHLKHFNKLTTPRRKDNYSNKLIKKYDKENVFDGVDELIRFREHWLNTHCFNRDIREIYTIPKRYRWFNYEEFRKHHIDLYPNSKLPRLLHFNFVVIGDGIRTLSCTWEDYNRAICMAKKYKSSDGFNNIRIIPWISTNFCIDLEKNNFNYIVFIDEVNLVYDSNSVKFDKFLHELFNTLNNDFKNRNERFIIDEPPKHYYINNIKELIKIRNDKLIKELKLVE